MELIQSEIEGCYLIKPFVQFDDRGGFVKVYNEPFFYNATESFQIREVYYSNSNKNVFRGFHFQLPPHHHSKIVSCIAGEVIDFVLDLRKNSSTFKHCISFNLNNENKNAVLVPKGCAHGFYSLKDESTLLYLVETAYEPSHDIGVFWSSVNNVHLDSSEVVLSDRDSSFMNLDEFNSPF